MIQSCLYLGEYEDAERYARNAMFMIKDMADNFIPFEQQPHFLADASYYLARAILNLAQAGDIPPEGKQKAGEEAITLARQALELRTQLYGIDITKIATSMGTLAQMLDYFSNVDDDEVLRLYEQAKVIFSRVEGSSSYNVAAGEGQLGNTYINRARRAEAVNDLDRCMINLGLAVPHLLEAVRIYTATNNLERANWNLLAVAEAEEQKQRLGDNRVSVDYACLTLALFSFSSFL